MDQHLQGTASSNQAFHGVWTKSEQYNLPFDAEDRKRKVDLSSPSSSSPSAAEE
jgi:hypothetical protein